MSDLQKYIFENANPAPINVLVLVIIIIMILYFIHKFFIKPSMTGKWIINNNLSNKQNYFKISHDKMNNKIVIYNSDGLQSKFSLHDNLFFNDKVYGIWDYKNTAVIIPRLNVLEFDGTRKISEPIYLMRV
jgi:hypothetical protein